MLRLSIYIVKKQPNYLSVNKCKSYFDNGDYKLWSRVCVLDWVTAKIAYHSFIIELINYNIKKLKGCKRIDILKIELNDVIWLV